MHGGVVVEVKAVDCELVAKPTAIQLYLRDHGEPTDVCKGQGHGATLVSTTTDPVDRLGDGG